MRLLAIAFAALLSLSVWTSGAHAQEKRIIWTGPFLGASAGLGLGSVDSHATGSIGLKSFVGSVRAGYLHELDDGWVLGGEIGYYPLAGLFGKKDLNPFASVDVQVNHLVYGSAIAGHTFGKEDRWLLSGKLGVGYGTDRIITDVHTPFSHLRTAQTLSMPSVLGGVSLQYALTGHVSVGSQLSYLYAQPGHASLNAFSSELMVIYRFGPDADSR